MLLFFFQLFGKVMENHGLGQAISFHKACGMSNLLVSVEYCNFAVRLLTINLMIIRPNAGALTPLIPLVLRGAENVPTHKRYHNIC